MTKGTFVVGAGSLFPALHRLEERGWLRGSWGESESRRRAKYYQLTAAGQRRLRHGTDEWRRIALAIERALAT